MCGVWVETGTNSIYNYCARLQGRLFNSCGAIDRGIRSFVYNNTWIILVIIALKLRLMIEATYSHLIIEIHGAFDNPYIISWLISANEASVGFITYHRYRHLDSRTRRVLIVFAEGA